MESCFLHLQSRTCNRRWAAKKYIFKNLTQKREKEINVNGIRWWVEHWKPNGTGSFAHYSFKPWDTWLANKRKKNSGQVGVEFWTTALVMYVLQDMIKQATISKWRKPNKEQILCGCIVLDMISNTSEKVACQVIALFTTKQFFSSHN